MPTVVIH